MPATRGEEVELPRGDLAAVLFDAARDDAEFAGRRHHRRAARRTTDGVDVTFERRPPRRFDLVVGADGLHSTVRRLAFGPERGLRRPPRPATSRPCRSASGRGHPTSCMHNTPGRLRLDPPGPRCGAGRLHLPRPRPMPGFDHRDTGQHKRIVTTAYADAGWRVPELLDRLAADRGPLLRRGQRGAAPILGPRPGRAARRRGVVRVAVRRRLQLAMAGADTLAAALAADRRPRGRSPATRPHTAAWSHRNSAGSAAPPACWCRRRGSVWPRAIWALAPCPLSDNGPFDRWPSLSRSHRLAGRRSEGEASHASGGEAHRHAGSGRSLPRPARAHRDAAGPVRAADLRAARGGPRARADGPFAAARACATGRRTPDADRPRPHDPLGQRRRRPAGDRGRTAQTDHGPARWHVAVDTRVPLQPQRPGAGGGQGLDRRGGAAVHPPGLQPGDRGRVRPAVVDADRRTPGRHRAGHGRTQAPAHPPAVPLADRGGDRRTGDRRRTARDRHPHAAGLRGAATGRQRPRA